MTNCVVCQAFPQHVGAHFQVRDITSYLFSQRLRLRGPGQWTPLRGVFTASGKQVMVSVHMGEDDDARCAGGIWFLESQGPLAEPSEEPLPEGDLPATDAEREGARDLRRAS
jgi:hypothetical protein